MTILQPFLLLSYFFFHFWSENIVQPNVFRAVFHYYAVSVAIVSLLFWVLTRWTQSLLKGALIVSALILFFFLYGHAYYFIKQFLIETLQHRHVLTFFSVSLLAMIFLVLKTDTTRAVNAAKYGFALSAFLLAIPCSNILFHVIYKPVPEVPLYEYTVRLPQMHDVADQFPDIYYIILDEYAREDVLKEHFGYDNGEFLSFLKEKGFYVVSESYSNYHFSLPSLASSLNMTYVHKKFLREDDLHRFGPKMIRRNRLVRFLKKLGYRYITVDSGVYNMTEYSPEADSTVRYEGANEADLAFFNTTLLRIFGRYYFAESWRRRHLYNFKQLKKVSLMQSPKFVFAHILLPHPPFVFDQDGQPAKSFRRVSLKPGRLNVYDQLYLNQLIYTNQLVKDLLQVILDPAREPPIIALQSDHGVEAKETDLRDMALMRHSNLLAVYFPDGRYDSLSTKLTPVNVFRIVLDQFFHTRMGKLEDKLYYNVTDYCDDLEDRDAEPLCRNVEPEQDLLAFVDVTP